MFRNILRARIGSALLFGTTLALAAADAQAHFGMIIPSDDMVKQEEGRSINIDIMFWHPFEGYGMNLAKPAQFGVLAGGRKTSLADQLLATKTRDVEGNLRDTFKLDYKIKKPGDHIFYMKPQPYWEPSEESFIIHYTKVIVNAFGLEEGWDEPVGLKTEIVPLTRPYGLYTGNVFQGQVLVNGKPAPGTQVEVEYYNQDGKLSVEADPLITQIVKADANGVFVYGIPKSGWWGFAALNKDEKPIQQDGKDYPVEIGAVLWVKTHDMK